MIDLYFSPVYTLFANGYLAALDVLLLAVLLVYLHYVMRSNPQSPQIYLVAGLWVWVTGNAIGRIWIMLYRWQESHGYDTSWMKPIPVLPIGLGLTSLGLAWFVIFVIGARYGIWWAVVYIAAAIGFAGIISL